MSFGASLPEGVTENVALRNWNTWKVGGAAEYFAQPAELRDLLALNKWSQSRGIPVTVLGGGSNVLVSDEGISGLVLSLVKFRGCQTRREGGRLFLSALSGTPKSELLKIFLKEKLSAALFLAGIPGEVGGGVVMNAGVSESISPREFVEIVDYVDVLRPSGDIERLRSDQLTWSYRHCEGWRPGIIVEVGISVVDQQVDSILDQVRDANRLRAQKQPLDLPSCGSVFVNPEGHKAAQLIDSCGLKGYTVGAAQVSTKHANFVVNLGGCTARDLWSVITFVQEQVWQKKSVRLQTEVLLLGSWASGK